MGTAEEIFDMFLAESEKLEAMISTADSQLSIPQIVQTYYQVINVSSMASMLRQTASTQEALLETIAETETMISDRFDAVVHPKIMARLRDSVRQCTQNLQSDDSSENKDTLYEELRQMMSTQEFVEQYDKGLS